MVIIDHDHCKWTTRLDGDYIYSKTLTPEFSIVKLLTYHMNFPCYTYVKSVNIYTSVFSLNIRDTYNTFLMTELFSPV